MELGILDFVLAAISSLFIPVFLFLLGMRDDIKHLKEQHTALMLKSVEEDNRHSQGISTLQVRLSEVEVRQRALIRKIKDFQGFLTRKGLAVRSYEELDEEENLG